MGKTTFTFLVGAVAGAYVAQNYKIPNVADTLTYAQKIASAAEKKMRK